MYPNVRNVLEVLPTSYELFKALKKGLSKPEKAQLKEIEELVEEDLFESLQMMENPKRKYNDNHFGFLSPEQRSTFLLAFQDIVPREVIRFEDFSNALDRVDTYYKSQES